MIKVTIKGTVLSVGPTQEFGNNGFKKQTVVIKTEDQYGNEIPVVYIKDTCGTLSSSSVGRQVEIVGRLEGRGFDGKDGRRWALDITAENTNLLQDAPAATPKSAKVEATAKGSLPNDAEYGVKTSDDDGDSLPF